MVAQPHRYLFGRFNVIGTYTDKRAFVLDGLTSVKVLNVYPYGWTFIDVAELDYPVENYSGNFIAGDLVKYRIEAESEVIDPKTRKITKQEVPNQITERAPFFLHVDTGMIAYHPTSGVINPPAFRNRFADLFEEAYDHLLVGAEIQSIKEQAKFLEEVQQLDEIRSLSIYLHPSNPSNRDVWDSFDKRMKALKATSYREESRFAPGASASAVVNDADTSAKSQMAEDGYGEAKANGSIGDKQVTISTANRPVEAKVSGDIANRREVLGLIGGAFQRISQRFKK